MEINTDVNEFKSFYNILTKNNPDYEPFLFPVRKNSKDPMVSSGSSWKDQQITYDKAIELLEQGYNIGIAATDKDRLCIVDVDDMDKVGNFKPTLTDISRKRIGRHAYYFTDDKPTDNIFEDSAKRNIPLNDAGEVRANWQYVVAPGSFVPCDEEELSRIPEEDRNNAGRYTVLDEREPESITFEDLPQVYKQKIYDDRQAKVDAEAKRAQRKTDKQVSDATKNEKNKSALWDLDISDIVPGSHRKTDRFEFIPLHGSKTGSNMSISNGLLHCWRHLVSHNALTALAVMAGVETCDKAGFAHNSGVPSYLDFHDGETVFEVWKYAKDHGYIPESDPIPSSALVYYALNNNYCNETDVTDGWKLPVKVYNKVIEDADFDTGRKPIQEKEPPKSNIKNTNIDIEKCYGYNSSGDVIIDCMGLADEIKRCYYVLSYSETPYIYSDGIFIKGTAKIKSITNDVVKAVQYKGPIKKIADDILFRVVYDDPCEDYPFVCPVDNVIPVKNGVIELNYQTGEKKLVPNSPYYRFIYKLPIEYNSGADSTFIHEEVIKKYVDPEWINVLYQIPAHALIQMMGAATFKKAYLLQGDAHAGKSSYLELLERTFGNHNIACVSLQDLSESRFGPAGLENKVMNIYDDLSDIPLKDSGKFKTITGKKRHDVERKGVQAYEADINAVHCYTCNTPPHFDERVRTDTAFWERWEYVRFTNLFEVDPFFYDNNFTPENIAGFFNMVLDYVIQIRNQKQLLIDSEASEVLQNWEFNADPLYRFLNEELEETEEVQYYEKEDFLRAYTRWCMANDVPEGKIPTSKSMLTKIGFKYNIINKQITDRSSVRKHRYALPYKFVKDARFAVNRVVTKSEQVGFT